MKLLKKEEAGIQEVYSCNVNNLHNYISENGIINHNCVIDSDYMGEIHIHLINVGKHTVTISPDEKIIQFLLLPITYANIIEVPTVEELYKDKNSERGEGGFGSTNKT